MLIKLLAGYFILAYVIATGLSLTYPFQLIWQEGSNFDSALRIVHGEPLYAAPSLAYAPLMYTPLYYYVTAAFTKLFGEDLIAGRMVSLLSFWATLILLYAWLRKEGLSKKRALLAPVALFAMYDFFYGWWNAVRVDSLFLILMFTGVFVYFYNRTVLSPIISGALLALAFFTKQQALMIALPLLLAMCFIEPRRAMAALATLIAGCALIEMLYSVIYGDWFAFYIWEIPARLPKFWDMTFYFWNTDIFGRVPIFFALTVFWLMWLCEHDRRRFLAYGGLFAGVFIAAWLSRVHSGGMENVLLPLYAVFCITSPLAIQDAIRHKLIPANACWLLLLVQLFGFFYNPLELAPSRKIYLSDRAYMDYIGKLPGEVFIPDLQFVQTKVGKQSTTWRNGGHDFLNIGDNPVGNKLKQDLQEALTQKRFSAIILFSQKEMPEKDATYRFKEKIVSDNTLHMVHGMRLLPNYVYVPKADKPQEPPR